MKRYEKIILIVFSFTLMFQLLAFSGKAVILVFGTWLLSASYLIGGYWLFQTKENKNAILAVLSGIIFSISIFNLPFLIWLRIADYYKYIPIVIGVLFLILTIYLFLKRKSDTHLRNIKLIWVRSLIISIVVSFFTYAPMSFKPYRVALYVLNNGRDDIQANIQMFDYTEQYEKALEEEDCDNAIKFAVQSNEAGKKWLGMPLNLKKEKEKYKADKEYLEHLNQIDLWPISGTYTSLHEAYTCKANKYYNNNQYEKALKYYLKSEKALSDSERKSEYWEEEHVLVKNKIALCYRKLYDYEKADSLFIEVIEQYADLKDSTDRNSAQFLTNLGRSFSDQKAFEYANVLYKSAIVTLEKENTNDELIKKDIISNYHSLVFNFIQTDSLSKAKFYIDESYKLVDKSTFYFCKTILLDGIYFYELNNYKKADEILSKGLTCTESLLDPTDQNIAENLFLLSKVKIALAEYDTARKLLQRGFKINVGNHGKNNRRHASFLNAEAQLDKIRVILNLRGLSK